MNKAYNNFDFPEYRLKKRISNKKLFVSLTNNIIFKFYNIRFKALKQNQWCLNILLSAFRIMENMSNNPNFYVISIYETLHIN